MSFMIAIDGPAGAGKSTVAKLLAAHYSYIYVDTGAMYRAIALYLLENNVSDKSKFGAACADADVRIVFEGGMQRVMLGDCDVTETIRSEEVGDMASVSAALPEVRSRMVELQRSLAASNNVVMDGRDIGTVVLPNAQAKIYLTASSLSRAKRRYNELVEKGEKVDIAQIQRDIDERDRRDMTREISPLKQAEDAVLVDTSDMGIDETVAHLIAICDKKGANI